MLPTTQANSEVVIAGIQQYPCANRAARETEIDVQTAIKAKARGMHVTYVTCVL